MKKWSNIPLEPMAISQKLCVQALDIQKLGWIATRRLVPCKYLLSMCFQQNQNNFWKRMQDTRRNDEQIKQSSSSKSKDVGRVVLSLVSSRAGHNSNAIPLMDCRQMYGPRYLFLGYVLFHLESCQQESPVQMWIYSRMLEKQVLSVLNTDYWSIKYI